MAETIHTEDTVRLHALLLKAQRLSLLVAASQRSGHVRAIEQAQAQLTLLREDAEAVLVTTRALYPFDHPIYVLHDGLVTALEGYRHWVIRLLYETRALGVAP